jgi:hypothetical protein
MSSLPTWWDTEIAEWQPPGPPGVLPYRLVIRKDLESIFDYRAAKIADLSGGRP